jgi:hypothetical protein
MAMGFGPTTTATTLGQPLNFAAVVVLDANETLPRNCVFADVYAGERKIDAANVRATLEPGGSSGQKRVRVTTTTPINDPVVTVEISIGCEPRVSQRFVAFADPPARRAADGNAGDVGSPARAHDAGSAAPGDLASAAASAPEAAASDLLQHEREQTQLLRAQVARLQDDSRTTQQTVAALQTRLRQAEIERYANGLVYALAGAAALFALFVAMLLRQRRAAAAASTATQPPAMASTAAAASVTTSASTMSALTGSKPLSSSPTRLGGIAAAMPVSVGQLALVPLSEHARPDATHGVSAVAAAKASEELSIEALIDLEQQAEFFVVLGQDDEAIGLFAGYLASEGGKSPLPYLKLLEIHQRCGDREAYEQTREAFNKQFNASAPDWSTDLQSGRSLEDYPQTIARLQALWPTPLHAMQALDGLLFKRHRSDDSFEFPAYQELMFLYSIARDLAGNVETESGSIDFFLPLEAMKADPHAGNVPPASPHETSEAAVDLDVSASSGGSAASDFAGHHSEAQRRT